MRNGWRFWRRQVLVGKLIVKHVGGPCDSAESVTQVIRPIERVNLQMTLDQWLESDPKGKLIGYSRDSLFGNANVAQMLIEDFALAPVQRQRIASSPDEFLDCVMRGVYLLHFQSHPIVILLSNPEMRYETPMLEVLALDRPIAQAAMKQLLDEVAARSVYKGRTIFLEEDDRTSQVAVRFHPLPPISRDSVVLPEAIFNVIERSVLGMFRHRDLLRRSGRPTRHGLLLHGPPGTGKTLMLRYLASSCPDHTVILLNGRQGGLIRESCQIARMLAPSLVLLEDVDLVGEDRSSHRCPVILQDLMDEMDGLGPKADVIFLLTTNRPEAIEPALSGRPGRIDQAIEFPLPDENCRRKLFLLYGKGLDLSGIDLDRWITRTEGVSPAFIEELLRKAALMTAERGALTEPLQPSDQDVDQAMEELVCFGGELTQKLLGFKQFGFAKR